MTEAEMRRRLGLPGALHEQTLRALRDAYRASKHGPELMHVGHHRYEPFSVDHAIGYANRILRTGEPIR